MTRAAWRIGLHALAALVAGAIWCRVSTPGAAGVPYVGADFGVSAAIAVISFLGNLFGLFGGKIDRNVKRALEGMRNAVVDVARILATFARDSGVLFARIVRWLRRQIVDVIIPFLKRMDVAVRRFFAWLTKTFDPLLRLLKRLRDNWLKLYAKWLAPIFALVAAVRYTLRLLNRIGVDWAGELEQKIGAIEDKLVLKIGLVAAAINDAINWINRIITIDGVLQQYVLLASYWKHAGDVFSVAWNARTFGLTGSGKQHVISGGNAETPLEVQEEIRDAIRADLGPLAPYVLVGVDYTRERLAEF